jgi:hypothetical protein
MPACICFSPFPEFFISSRTVRSLSAIIRPGESPFLTIYIIITYIFFSFFVS